MRNIDFEQVFARLPSPYMILDDQLRFVMVNAEYERVTMRPAVSYLGRYVFDEFPNEGESGKRLRESFTCVLATGKDDTIAYLHYDIPRPPEAGGGLERRFWTCHHTPILDEDGVVRFIVQNTVDVTELVRLREAQALPFSTVDEAVEPETRLLERARDAELRQRALLAEGEDFRRIFQQAPGFIAILSGSGHVFTFANDSYVKLVGGRPVLGRTVREALPEIEGQGFIEMLDSVYSTGQSAGGEAVRLMLQRAPGEPPRETFLDFSYDAIRDRAGTITGVFVQGMDRTEAVRTQRRQKLLLDELNHRVKNTLATVQSLAAQTFRHTDDPKLATRAFEKRLHALSHAHDLLSVTEWSSTSLSQLVENALPASSRARVDVVGPTVLLGPNAAVAIAMILHELVTNAVHHGALSCRGRLMIAWRRLEDGGLVLDWIESGVPAIAEPVRTGFGTRMIERIVAGDLAGTYAPAFMPDGFGCEIGIPAATIELRNE